jgi:glycosyltransferase involved in cell wall biosynthesis
MHHLLLVTVEDPHNPKSWSGTPFNMLKALEKNFDQVSVLSSQVPKRNLFGAALRSIFGRKKYPLWMTNFALKAYAKRMDATIKEKRPDVVLCISSQHLIFAKELDLPVFMISDAPWIAYKSAYKDYEALPLLSSKYAEKEAAVAKRISGVIYPTPWACKEAEARFCVPKEKIHLLPFGANSYCASSDDQVFYSIRQRKLQQLNFLFVGKDWDRKGGPLALEVVRLLNERGLTSTLQIVGCRPELSTKNLRYVRLHGYLSPADPEDCKKLVGAFSQADFFLVPSLAECFGLVFAEAQSYGLPCISLNNHGIPGVVEDKETGLLFESATPAGRIADAIIQLID